MARSYRRDSRGRFSGGAGNAKSGSGTNRASSVTVKGSNGKSVKGELGVKGKRLRNNFKPNMLTENGSIWTKRKASARGLRGSRPKDTMANPGKTNPSLKRRIAYK
jgi:hypothetical protein